MISSLDMINAPYIRDLQPGLLEEGYFLLRRVHLNSGKNNKPYLRFLLADQSGHLPAVYFSGAKEIHSIRLDIGSGLCHSAILRSGTILNPYYNYTLH